MKVWLGLFLGALLVSCQTVPSSAFSGRQVEVLEAEGFEKVGENYELGLEDRLLFDTDRSEVKPHMVDRLHQLARRLIAVDIRGARLDGHTDSTGSSGHNLQLSQSRANAVMQILAQGGLEQRRIEAVGYGETDPIESNQTSEGRAQNRRVVVVVRPADLLPL